MDIFQQMLLGNHGSGTAFLRTDVHPGCRIQRTQAMMAPRESTLRGKPIDQLMDISSSRDGSQSATLAGL
jgi:hypothetical protein